MKKHTLLFICLGVISLAGCPAKTANNNANNNANTANNNAANKNTNAVSQTPSPATEKSVTKVDFAGNWDSEFFNKKGETHTQLTLNIKQTGETVTGTYSVTDYIGDEPQVEDGNQTPFTGTVKDGVATIKFDVNATVPGYEENVKYKEPTDGKPSTATLTINSGKMQWKLTGGDSPMEIPKEITLSKGK
ncbi:hypothetical protein BH10ACI1_BH10ACI1_13810 [soil metagenome]